MNTEDRRHYSVHGRRLRPHDALSTPVELGRRLRDHGLPAPGEEADAHHLSRARALREALRSAMRHDPAGTGAEARRDQVAPAARGDDGDDARARTAAQGRDGDGTGARVRDSGADRDANLRDESGQGRGGQGQGGQGQGGTPLGFPFDVRIRPSGGSEPVLSADPVTTALGRIVLASLTATAEGTWHRLKVCPAADCQWLFYDTSRTGRARWCSPRLCGNRMKIRVYRRRHPEERP